MISQNGRNFADRSFLTHPGTGGQRPNMATAGGAWKLRAELLGHEQVGLRPGAAGRPAARCCVASRPGALFRGGATGAATHKLSQNAGHRTCGA